MDKIKKGDTVQWNYGRGKGEGNVAEIHHKTISRKVQGATVKRKGTDEEPALVLKQNDKKIIKSASEVTKK
ncbi:hypothetical protein GCM10028807_25510 [Spirosoma daeguense]